MSNREEDYLDKLLNSVSTQNKNKEDKKQRSGRLNFDASAILDAFDDDWDSYSTRKSMSGRFSEFAPDEDEFLRAFDAELNEADSNGYLSDFEAELADAIDGDPELAEMLINTSEKPEQKVETSGEKDSVMPEVMDAQIPAEKPSESAPEEVPEPVSIATDDTTDLNPADILAGAISQMEGSNVEATEETSVEEALAELNAAEEAFEAAEGEEPNLSGEEQDLLSLLNSTEEFGELGDLLSGNPEIVEMDGEGQIEEFAAQEMKAQEVASGEAPEEEETVAPKKGFLAKILSLFKKNKEEEEEAVDITPNEEIDVEGLSEENLAILKQLEGSENSEEAPAEEEKGKKGKKGKKEKKEKKPKEKKPKKEKPKKEKKPKEKKPKEVDNTPPLPKVPVILIFVMVISLGAMIMIGTNLISYGQMLSKAETAYQDGRYSVALQTIKGSDVKEKDEVMYNKILVLSSVSGEYDAYRSFKEYAKEDMALDSLVCAAGRVELNAKAAESLECTGELAALKGQIEASLQEYGMSYKEAVDLYGLRKRDDYTLAIYRKLDSLGLTTSVKR